MRRIARTWAASIEAGRPLYRPAGLALAIPSSWRSRRRFVELGEHAEHVEKALAGGGAGVDRLLGRLG
jgi:hypothetical protein